MSQKSGNDARLKRRRWLEHYYGSNHRKALSTLLSESDQRCGYSLQHVDDVGRRCMEVDHYDPRKDRGKRRNQHGNLIAATRTANGKKLEFWPTEEEKEQGLYIINPYEEHDYGKHIVENYKTGKVVGKTTTGRWHIVMLDLNAEHLVLRRKLRNMIEAKALTAAGAVSAKGKEQYLPLVQQLVGKARSLEKLMLPKQPNKVVHH